MLEWCLSREMRGTYVANSGVRVCELKGEKKKAGCTGKHVIVTLRQLSVYLMRLVLVQSMALSLPVLFCLFTLLLLTLCLGGAFEVHCFSSPDSNEGAWTSEAVQEKASL